MMKKIILALILIPWMCNAIHAQENPPKLLIMGVPQYIFNQGIRIDVDLPTKNYKSWWVFSPQYFINVTDLNGFSDNNFKSLHGYGLNIYHRGFLSKQSVEKGTYISGGIGYQHFNIAADFERWISIEQDGLNYMQMVSESSNIYINKVLAEALIGYQKEITSRLYIDFYLGIGLRYSFHKQPEGIDRKYNSNASDYGYTGTVFVGGIRFGVGI